MTLPLKMMFGIIASQQGSAPPPVPKSGFYSGTYTGNSAGQVISCPGVDLKNAPGFISIKANDAEYHWCQTVTEDGPNVQYGSSGTGITYDLDAITAFNDGSFDTGGNDRVNATSDQHLFWAMSGRDLISLKEYTGNGGTQNIPLDLVNEPSMIWVKEKNASNWAVYTGSGGPGKHMILNLPNSETVSNCWNNTAPTKNTLSLGNDVLVNASGRNYMAMAFCWNAGHCVGIGYTGSSSPVEVNLGFDPDIVIIKCRTTAVAWVVFSKALGINPIGSNDPFFQLDSKDRYVTGNDFVYPISGGIGINAGNNLNLSGEEYFIIAWKNGGI
jgi:hypothetical protein